MDVAQERNAGVTTLRTQRQEARRGPRLVAHLVEAQRLGRAGEEQLSALGSAPEEGLDPRDGQSFIAAVVQAQPQSQAGPVASDVDVELEIQRESAPAAHVDACGQSIAASDLAVAVQHRPLGDQRTPLQPDPGSKPLHAGRVSVCLQAHPQACKIEDQPEPFVLELDGSVSPSDLNRHRPSIRHAGRLPPASSLVILADMKIYTRGGDEGETSLFGGRRVRKDAPRVEAYGAVDELNAILGLAIAEIEQADLLDPLRAIQASLFDLGAELATPDLEQRQDQGKGVPRVGDRDVAELERWIDGLSAELEPLHSFIVPGGTRPAGLLHLARTVCRRAERRVISLADREVVAPVVVRYLNRLSDFLFVVARVVNRRSEIAEPVWVGRER